MINAFPRNRAARAGQTAVGLAIKDHGDNRAGYANAARSPVALRLERVARNDSDHQSDSDRNRKGDRKSGHVDGGDQQQVGQIEDGAANQRRNDVRPIGGMNIVQETGGVVAACSPW